jgi:hypothetical protein
MNKIKKPLRFESPFPSGRELDYLALKGIFEKGTANRELSDEADELLDATASLLITTHKDKTILPIVVDMIFYRNRKNLFTHDLIWAFFKARDPHSLILIANYLGSSDKRDVELACKLLDFIPSVDMSMIDGSKNRYMTLFYWLQENYPFIYFTGESFQRTSKPIPYMVDLDAKYLCRRVSVYSGKLFTPLTEKETNIITSFAKLDKYNKQLLSSFSLRIHSKDIYLWRSLINYPITRQINIAKARLIF